MFGIRGFCSSSKEPPFQNNCKFQQQIEMWIQPNRQFPYVQLQELYRLWDSAKVRKGAHSSYYRCFVCNKTYPKLISLKYHVIHLHSDHELVRADPLFAHNVELHKRYQRRRSRKYHNLVKNFSCSKCPLTFKKKSHLDRHENIHGETFRCEFCSVGFKQAQGLKSHKNLIHPDVQIQSTKVMEDTTNAIAITDIKMEYVEADNNVCPPKSSLNAISIHPGERNQSSEVIEDTNDGNIEQEYITCDTSQIHENNKSNNSKNDCLCVVCNASLSRPLLLKFHLVARHSDHELVRSDPLFAHHVEMYKRHRQRLRCRKLQRRFSCSKCSLTFKRKVHRDKHENIHGDTFRCEFCPVGFQQSNGITSHMKNMHPDARYQVIQDTDGIRKQRNWKSKKLLKKYNCSKCSLVFRDKHNLDNHENIHGDAFRCEICPAGFKLARGLSAHMQRIHPVDSNQSSEVITMQTWKHDYQRKPVLSNTNVDYQCPHCPRNLSRLDALDTHLKLHDMENVHVCDDCGFRYATLNELQRHKSFLKCDSDQQASKSFKCPHLSCNSSQKSALKLSIHIRKFHHTERGRLQKTQQSHNLVKKFRCSKCPLTFKKKYHLDRHENIHGDAFGCELCSVGFKLAQGLKSHKNLIHPDVQIQSTDVMGHTTKDVAITDIKMEYVEADNNACPPKSSLNAIKCIHPGERNQSSEVIEDTDDGNIEQEYITSDTSQIHKHKKSNHSRNKCLCVVCGASLSRPLWLKFHLVARHSDHELVRSDPLFAHNVEMFKCYRQRLRCRKLQRRFSCSKCSLIFKRKVHRDKHENIHGDSFRCEFCSVGFKLAQGLTSHMKNMHPDARNQVIQDTDGIRKQRNWKSKKLLKKFNCSKCSLVFRDKQNRDNHENIHGDAFRCELCFAGFKQSQDLNSHKNLIHPDVQIQSTDVMEHTTKDVAITEIKMEEYVEADNNACPPPSSMSAIKCIHPVERNQSSEVIEDTDDGNIEQEYITSDTSQIHKHNKLNNSENDCLCVVCDRSFSTPRGLKFHLVARHSDHQLVRSDPLFAHNVEMYKLHRQRLRCRRFSCSKCSLMFRSNCHRNRHETVHGDAFRCEFCPVGFKQAQGLKSHKNLIHPAELIQSTKVMEDTTKDIAITDSKMDYVEADNSVCPPLNGDRFCCQFCGLGFKKACGLTTHIRFVHPDVRNQSSEVIKITDGNSSKEDIAIKTAQNQKNKSNTAICPVCKQGFAKSSLARHMALRHSGQTKKYLCIVCYKSCSSLLLLKYHSIALHSEHDFVRSDPHFVQNVAMYKRHRQVLQNWKSRNFLKRTSCSKCSLVFKHKCNRDKHQRIHGDTFRCESCSAGFKQANGLSSHMKLVHPDHHNQYKVSSTPNEGFQCPHCSSSHTSAINLNRHIRNRHRIERDTLKKTVQPKSSPKTTKFSCSKCSLTFKKRHRRDIHENSHGDTFRCEFCSVGFKQAEGLVLHKNLIHKDFRDLYGEDIEDRTSTNDIIVTDIKEDAVDNNVCSPSNTIKAENTALSWGRGITDDFSAPTPQSDGTVSNILPTTAYDLHCHKSKLQSDSDKRSSKQFKCLQLNCNSSHTSAINLNRHIRKCHRTEMGRLKQSVQPTINSKTKFSCSKCSLTFRKKHHHDIHENSHGDTFRCEFCSVGFKQAEGLTLHKNLIHQDYRDLFCQDGISTNDNNDITFTDIKMEYVEAVDNNGCPTSNAIKAKDPVLSWERSISDDSSAPTPLGDITTSIIFPTTVLKMED